MRQQAAPRGGRIACLATRGVRARFAFPCPSPAALHGPAAIIIMMLAALPSPSSPFPFPFLSNAKLDSLILKFGFLFHAYLIIFYTRFCAVPPSPRLVHKIIAFILLPTH